MKGPVVITGGGTGGHIFPMQAIAEALQSRGLKPDDLRYVGSRRGQESALLSGSISLTLLPGRGIQRSLSARALVANVFALAGLAAAVVGACYKVGRWRPSVVVSLGGYASFALGYAAALWRCPLVLVELDAVPGAAHRLLGRYAARRCTAFASDDARSVLTGAPVRNSIASIDRAEPARRQNRLAYDPPIDDARTVIVVMTGSLGSSRVNRAVSELARLWADRDDLTVLHVAGRRDYESVQAQRPATNGLDYRVEAFADMSVLWAIADLALCRAGATTVAELMSVGVASVLVPLPGAPGDHQSKNADTLVRAGAAIRIDDGQCTAGTLGAALEKILEPSVRDAMGAAAHALARPDAAQAIARVVAEVGKLA